MRISAAHALLALGALLIACAATPDDQGQPVVRAAARGAGNAVGVRVTGRTVGLDIWSHRGIGAATVELVSGPAPEAAELRLYLRGLEELRVSYGQEVMVVSVTSGPGHKVSQRRVGPDGAEQELSPDSPGWLAVAIVADGPEPSIPLHNGHFAVALPAAALAGDEGVFSLTWIDFFR